MRSIASVKLRVMNLDCRMQPLGLALLLVLGMVVLPRCRKVNNPHPEARERHGFLFFNYSIDNPMETASPTALATDTKVYQRLTLRLLVWTNYLPATVLNGFTERYGAHVTMTVYDSNDELHDRVAQGGRYDIVMPAGFMTQRLIQEGLVHELDLTHFQPEERRTGIPQRRVRSRQLPFRPLSLEHGGHRVQFCPPRPHPPHLGGPTDARLGA